MQKRRSILRNKLDSRLCREDDDQAVAGDANQICFKKVLVSKGEDLEWRKKQASRNCFRASRARFLQRSNLECAAL